MGVVYIRADKHEVYSIPYTTAFLYLVLERQKKDTALQTPHITLNTAS